MNDIRPAPARERAETMAIDKYPARLPYNRTFEQSIRDQEAFVAGFLARDAEPTTVSVDRLDEAASGIADFIQSQNCGLRPDPVEVWFMAEAAFRAAGFRIEGDNDDR